MKSKLAIFDLDGTLFDTADVNYSAYKRSLNDIGFDIDYRYFCDFCNGRNYREFIIPIVGDNDDILENVHKKKKDYYSLYLSKARENKHLFNVIDLISNDYYLALVTTASKKNTYEILNYFEKNGLFDLVLTQEDVKNKKPDPEGFLKAMDYFGIDCKNTVIFEDADVGILAAKKANCTVFRVEKF